MYTFFTYGETLFKTEPFLCYPVLFVYLLKSAVYGLFELTDDVPTLQDLQKQGRYIGSAILSKKIGNLNENRHRQFINDVNRKVSLFSKQSQLLIIALLVKDVPQGQV
jgi:hypothetical protein